MSTYAERRDRLVGQVRGAKAGSLGLAKDTSNLFRDRAARAKRLLDVRAFNHVLAVDAARGWIDAEGMTTYEELVSRALEHGVMPAIVPELKTITLGGAAAGVGIEASSFRYGLVHETLLEMEIMTGDGSIIVCRPDNEHSDLYYGFPNSYGTLGYALRLRAAAIPVKPFVELEHRRFATRELFFEALAKACDSDADFVDGVAFAPGEYYLNVCRFVDHAPAVSDYTFEHIYFRSIREKPRDWLATADFIWRWDTDWFWCSKNVGAQHPLLRRLYGRKRLNSVTYQRIMRWNSRWGLTRALNRMRGLSAESVIQDVDIPIARAAEFLEFYAREIALWPQWICPIGVRDERFSLYPVRRGWYVNFGFWDVKRTREAHPPGHFNRRIEEKVSELGGIKSLYSDSYFAEAEFDRRYGGAAYAALKKKYDPAGAFPRLYDKCVLKA